MKTCVLQRVLLRFNSNVPSLLTSMWSMDGFQNILTEDGVKGIARFCPDLMMNADM